MKKKVKPGKPVKAGDHKKKSKGFVAKTYQKTHKKVFGLK